MTLNRFRLPVVLLAAGTLAGCLAMPQQQTPHWNPLDGMEANLVADQEDKDYVLCRMEFAGQAILLGSYCRAAPRLKEAYDQLEVHRQKTAAVVSSERFKFYKGETYERAMICFYLGYAEYLAGRFNEARIYLLNALEADKGAVVHEDTPQSYGEDFALAYYWLGKAYQKLNDAGNSQAAFRKAAIEVERKGKAAEVEADRRWASRLEKRRFEGEQWAYQTFRDPKKPELLMDGIVDLSQPANAMAAAASTGNPAVSPAPDKTRFLDPAFQGQANLVLTIELGRCPVKFLAGLHMERTEFARSATLPAQVKVVLDDHQAGEAFCLLDLWDQAATQDRVIEKEALQVGKAVLKEIGSHLPYVGSLFGHWDVSGDVRHWTSLPSQVYVYAARVKPGVHTVRLQMLDINGVPLPRWTNTYHGLPVGESGETCVLLRPRYDGDNVLPADKRSTAIRAGAKGYGEEIVLPY